jgi:membrane protein
MDGGAGARPARRRLTPRLAAGLVKKAAFAWLDDYAPSMGAALSYYTLFSLAPLLILVIAIAGMVFGEEAARGQIVGQLQGLIGEDGARAVQGLLESASKPGRSATASLLGLVTLLLGATSVFAELQSALDRIWRAPQMPSINGLWALLRARLLSLGLIASLGFLLLVSLVISAGIAAAGKWWGGLFPGWEVAFETVNSILSFGITTVLFAMIYRILPRVRVAWRDVLTGALATAALFTAGKFGIGFYLGTAGVASGFGAAGSLVVLLIWVYYSAQIFLLGAELTWVYAHEVGSRAGQTPPPPPTPPQTPRS